MEVQVGKFLRISALLSLNCSPIVLDANVIDPDDLAFFESRIRPILVENCYKCHSVEAEKLKGGLFLDSKPGLLRGGESGPAIIPGNSGQSRLINMVRRHPDFEGMPPKTRLPQSHIDDLVAWVDRGAPDPRLEEPRQSTVQSDFDLEERKGWWSLQPVKNPTPPTVRQQNWPSNDYDTFLLRKLEEKGWSPAQPADRRTLLRRLSFDLIGLAPSPQELRVFVNDQSEKAYQKQVDRLLASPHFGEKWARHWMDLTRYAETKSFEDDYTMPYTYRYRDYLIRAFNEDVPFDRFILESLAGDLLPEPRLNPGTGDNESVKGPGYIYLTEMQPGPPDLHQDEARIFSGMIDVVSKAFLGITLRCARCHDHKFDAVTTADYYSFYGMLRSSRFTYQNTVAEAVQKKTLRKLQRQKPKVRSSVFEAGREDVERAGIYLEARNRLLKNPELINAVEALEVEFSEKKNENKEAYLDSLRSAIEPYAKTQTEDEHQAAVLTNWVLLSVSPEMQRRWPELQPLFQGSEITAKTEYPTGELSASFAEVARSPNNWKLQGLTFDEQPETPGTLILSGSGPGTVQSILGNTLAAGQYAARVSGAIRSPDFILDGNPIELQVKGKFAAVRLVVRNYELTGRGPTTKGLYFPVNNDYWQTIQFETYLWKGLPAYLEIFQNGQATHSIGSKEKGPKFDDNAYLTFRFNRGPDWGEFWNDQVRDYSATSKEAALAATLEQLWHKGRHNKLDPAEAELLSAFFGAGLVTANTDRDKNLHAALSEYRELAREIPVPRFARSLVDGNQQDEPVYIRGNHKNPSREPNPRHFLDGLGGAKLTGPGSGRLEWAKHVAHSTNPLTARVLVNRLWHHIFGQGLVTTVNNFGKMGTAPSHPELLDFLAADFTRNDWSIKYMIRKMVLSSAYHMSSLPSPESLEEDPANTLLQHMPVKRLEAEAIRDHILACSGELDTTLFGPSTEAYVEDLLNSRAKPNSGPLDGGNRRSVYLEMRRNFLPSFLRAFDLPNATEPIGARSVTNVPAQSLALMNDPFVHQQAGAWAENLTASDLSEEDRLHAIHLKAYSRPATQRELSWGKNLLHTLADAYGCSIEDRQAWTDLCHLIYNRKDFIYLF